MHRKLFFIAAVVEFGAGLGAILAPKPVVALLLGMEAEGVALMVTRVLGVALFALGICCWGATNDSNSAERSGTYGGITLYNSGAGLLLLLFAATGKAHGIPVCGAALLHLGLAAAFVLARSRPW